MIMYESIIAHKLISKIRLDLMALLDYIKYNSNWIFSNEMKEIVEALQKN